MGVPGGAQVQSRSDLPEGHYEFLGRIPGRLPPKRFVIESDGSITWGESAETNGKSASAPATGAEKYEYPFIKWKGKRLLGSAKASGFLTTTYEAGLLKYQIQVQLDTGWLKSAGGVEKAMRRQGLTVELLDADGFKITEFVIPGNVLHEVQDESVMQGKGAVQFPEDLYRRAKDISIR